MQLLLKIIYSSSNPLYLFRNWIILSNKILLYLDFHYNKLPDGLIHNSVSKFQQMKAQLNDMDLNSPSNDLVFIDKVNRGSCIYNSENINEFTSELPHSFFQVGWSNLAVKALKDWCEVVIDGAISMFSFVDQSFDSAIRHLIPIKMVLASNTKDSLNAIMESIQSSNIFEDTMPKSRKVLDLDKAMEYGIIELPDDEDESNFVKTAVSDYVNEFNPKISKNNAAWTLFNGSSKSANETYDSLPYKLAIDSDGYINFLSNEDSSSDIINNGNLLETIDLQVIFD